MKKIAFAFVVLVSLQSIAQDSTKKFNLLVGTSFNGSSAANNSTTGIGIFAQPSFLFQNKIRVSLRIEPVALAHGVAMNDIGEPFTQKSGANFLLNNYLSGDVIFATTTGKRHLKKYYAGGSLLFLAQQRHVYDNTTPNSSQEFVTNFGAGIKLGVMIGKIDFSISANKIGNDFTDFIGVSLGYQFSRKR